MKKTANSNIIDGKKIASEIQDELKIELDKLKTLGILPNLTVILVGNNPASESYVNAKIRVAKQIGLSTHLLRMQTTISQEELIAKINYLNNSPDVHGILVQLPLPEHIETNNIIQIISPNKDVDGFHPYNIGSLMTGGNNNSFLPCTPAGIIELCHRKGIELAGKHAVVIGRSNIVGKPLSLLLQRENATVTMCHSHTEDLSKYTKKADILVSSVGKPNLITSKYVSRGVIVFDVGINRLPNGKLTGDVDFSQVEPLAAAITPVPGGIGPMTIAMLMKNTIMAAKKILSF